MTSNKAKKWNEAGIVLARDPEKKVKCPACEQNNLDVRNEFDPNMLERIIYCPVCGEKNYIRLRRPL